MQNKSETYPLNRLHFQTAVTNYRSHPSSLCNVCICLTETRLTSGLCLIIVCLCVSPRSASSWPPRQISAASMPALIKHDPCSVFRSVAPPTTHCYKLLNTFPSCAVPSARQEICLGDLASNGQRRRDLGHMPASGTSGNHSRSLGRIKRSMI